MSKLLGGFAAGALLLALALPGSAQAAGKQAEGLTTAKPSSAVTDVSARRRHRVHRRHYVRRYYRPYGYYYPYGAYAYAPRPYYYPRPYAPYRYYNRGPGFYFGFGF